MARTTKCMSGTQRTFTSLGFLREKLSVKTDSKCVVADTAEATLLLVRFKHKSRVLMPRRCQLLSRVWGRFCIRQDVFDKIFLLNLVRFEYHHNDTESRRALLLDVVVSKSAAILQLFASENEALPVRRDAFLVLDLLLDVFNGVRALYIEGDGLAGRGLCCSKSKQTTQQSRKHKKKQTQDLHSRATAQTRVEFVSASSFVQSRVPIQARKITLVQPLSCKPFRQLVNDSGHVHGISVKDFIVRARRCCIRRNAPFITILRTHCPRRLKFACVVCHVRQKGLSRSRVRILVSQQQTHIGCTVKRYRVARVWVWIALHCLTNQVRVLGCFELSKRSKQLVELGCLGRTSSPVPMQGRPTQKHTHPECLPVAQIGQRSHSRFR